MAEREGKKVSDLWQPVLLLDDDDGKTAETGKAFGDLTVKYHYQGATSKTTYNITADDWKESGEGEYWLRIGASEFSNEGKYQVSLACSGCRTHRFIVNVKDNTFAEVDDVINTISGNVDTVESQNSYISTQISGLPDIDTIVASGNAEEWNMYSDATLANQTELLTRVTNVSGLVDTLEAGQTTIQSQNNYISTQVSGVPDIDTIVASGDAAGWGAVSTTPVTVSGHTPGALNEIITSGNAAGWNIYSDATLANQTELLTRVTNVSGLVSSLNNSSTGDIVSGIFDEVIAGTKDFRTAAIEIWAYCANDVNLSGTVSGVLHTYYDPADSGIFTLEAQPSGRIRTDI